MQAVVYYDFGAPHVLRMQDVAVPAVRNKQVLIKVKAAALNPLDWHMMEGKPAMLRLFLGLHKSKGIGVDVAGVVEAVGREVTRFKAGDAVFGACKGALAEYACAPEKALALKPTTMTFEQAAALPIAGLTALQALRDKGRVAPGQHVLIIGAAGGVGTCAVQIAKIFGSHVTGVCSAGAAAMVRSLGADHVIDYTQEDFTANGESYDIVLDNVCDRAVSECLRSVRPNGVYIAIGGGSPDAKPSRFLFRLLRMLFPSDRNNRRLVPFFARTKSVDLEALAALVTSGNLTPVIDRVYPMHEARDAMEYLENGHAHGKLIVIPVGAHAD